MTRCLKTSGDVHQDAEMTSNLEVMMGGGGAYKGGVWG